MAPQRKCRGDEEVAGKELWFFFSVARRKLLCGLAFSISLRSERAQVDLGRGSH